MYGSDKIGEVKFKRGKKHENLGMVMDYSEENKLKIDMSDYVQGIILDFSEVVVGSKKLPWNERLIKVDTALELLSSADREIFHTFVMKGMLIEKRSRPDILPAISFVSAQVKSPNQGDMIRLKRVLSYLTATKKEVLTFEANNIDELEWYLDSLYAVHDDMRSYTEAVIRFGKGGLNCVSRKQKVNARSSTEAELIAIDDTFARIMWARYFLECILTLARNGNISSGKRTRHFIIKLFYITDLVRQGQVTVKYCTANAMTADYLTKPLVGRKSHGLTKKIMNIDDHLPSDVKQECVSG